MTETTNVLAFRQPSTVDDPLTDILRAGARDLLARAIEIEVDTFLAGTSELTLPDGRARLVRHGYGPARQIQTGIGPGEVARPKVRDRGASGAIRIPVSSPVPPLGGGSTKNLDALLPVLCLRGIVTGDFQDALSALLGKDAPNLSQSVIARLTADWQAEDERWQRRDLSARRYVYLWADGVYLQARVGDHSECILWLVGATPEGRKELVGFQVGARESAQSWRELLIDVKQRGLRIAPELAVGDGALGFWKALDEVFPGTRPQLCWCRKVINVLDKLPKSVQSNAHRDLREIWMAPNRAAAEAALDVFTAKYAPKYRNAVDCLIKDPCELLTFYDFPAEHWAHL